MKTKVKQHKKYDIYNQFKRNRWDRKAEAQDYGASPRVMCLLYIMAVHFKN